MIQIIRKLGAKHVSFNKNVRFSRKINVIQEIFHCNIRLIVDLNSPKELPSFPK